MTVPCSGSGLDLLRLDCLGLDGFRLDCLRRTSTCYRRDPSTKGVNFILVHCSESEGLVVQFILRRPLELKFGRRLVTPYWMLMAGTEPDKPDACLRMVRSQRPAARLGFGGHTFPGGCSRNERIEGIGVLSRSRHLHSLSPDHLLRSKFHPPLPPSPSLPRLTETPRNLSIEFGSLQPLLPTCFAHARRLGPWQRATPAKDLKAHRLRLRSQLGSA